MESDSDLLLIELGAVVLGLAVVARVARRIGMPALPMYLLAGLAFGRGGVFELPASSDFIEVGAEIGVILMLLMLGLEFSVHELITNVRRSYLSGFVDLVLNFTPGLVAGLLLGFDLIIAVLLGGITYISSSGIVAKLVADLDRIGNHETPVVLSMLVIEDLAMVLYLPIVSGVLFGDSPAATTMAVADLCQRRRRHLGSRVLVRRPVEHTGAEPFERGPVADPARRNPAGRRCRRAAESVDCGRRVPRRGGALR